MRTVAGVAVAIMLMGASAQETPATCVLPEAPAVERPVKPTRPRPPACVDEARNRHTCNNRTIAAYNAEMEAYGTAFTAYVDAVNAYGRKLADYVVAVNGYAQCEQRIVIPSAIIEG